VNEVRDKLVNTSTTQLLKHEILASIQGCHRQVLQRYNCSLMSVANKLLQQKNQPALALVDYVDKLLANFDD
jgi:hypothetical protein